MKKRIVFFIIISFNLFSVYKCSDLQDISELSSEWMNKKLYKNKPGQRFPGKFSKLLEFDKAKFTSLMTSIETSNAEPLILSLWLMYTKTEDGRFDDLWKSKDDLIHWWYSGDDIVKKRFTYLYREWKTCINSFYSVINGEELNNSSYNQRYFNLLVNRDYGCKMAMHIRSLGSLALPLLIAELEKSNNQILTNETLSFILLLIRKELEIDHPKERITKELVVKWWKVKGHQLYLVLPKKSRPCPCEGCQQLKKKHK